MNNLQVGLSLASGYNYLFKAFICFIQCLHHYIFEYTCKATSASSTFRQLDVQHLFRKNCFHLFEPPCLSHVYLLGMLAYLSMFFLDMREFHVILMYHMQGMPFPNMLSVQSLCFTSIEQHGMYISLWTRHFTLIVTW